MYSNISIKSTIGIMAFAILIFAPAIISGDQIEVNSKVNSEAGSNNYYDPYHNQHHDSHGGNNQYNDPYGHNNDNYDPYDDSNSNKPYYDPYGSSNNNPFYNQNPSNGSQYGKAPVPVYNGTPNSPKYPPNDKYSGPTPPTSRPPVPTASPSASRPPPTTSPNPTTPPVPPPTTQPPTTQPPTTRPPTTQPPTTPPVPPPTTTPPTTQPPTTRPPTTQPPTTQPPTTQPPTTPPPTSTSPPPSQETVGFADTCDGVTRVCGSPYVCRSPSEGRPMICMAPSAPGELCNLSQYFCTGGSTCVVPPGQENGVCTLVKKKKNNVYRRSTKSNYEYERSSGSVGLGDTCNDTDRTCLNHRICAKPANGSQRVCLDLRKRGESCNNDLTLCSYSTCAIPEGQWQGVCE
ncbi:hypothetical protein BDF19DRAFT_410032 [Syncephalis fuscata]|nr:hypothetical protein BDF19DRAFT_410032 [Syncephalis fuscata]